MIESLGNGARQLRNSVMIRLKQDEKMPLVLHMGLNWAQKAFLFFQIYLCFLRATPICIHHLSPIYEPLASFETAMWHMWTPKLAGPRVHSAASGFSQGRPLRRLLRTSRRPSPRHCCSILRTGHRIVRGTRLTPHHPKASVFRISFQIKRLLVFG